MSRVHFLVSLLEPEDLLRLHSGTPEVETSSAGGTLRADPYFTYRVSLTASKTEIKTLKDEYGNQSGTVEVPIEDLEKVLSYLADASTDALAKPYCGKLVDDATKRCSLPIGKIEAFICNGSSANGPAWDPSIAIEKKKYLHPVDASKKVCVAVKTVGGVPFWCMLGIYCEQH